MLQRKILVGLALFLCSPMYAQRKVEIAEPVKQSITPEAKVIKRKVAIGRFSNETQYGKGVFYDKENDPMGKQALDILSAKLAASGKFLLLERNDMTVLLQECQNGDKSQAQIGADYMIVGSITQFGRKNTGKQGLFTNTNMQTVEAAVSIRLVDVSSGLIIYSGEGKGQAELTSKTTLGMGGKAGFDATLSDKAISEAIGQLVENIINKCTDKPWQTFILSSDADGTIIAGGISQGITIGDTFEVVTKGKKVKNPQTGIMIELPGKRVGTVTVQSTGGDTSETEYSIVSTNGTEINSNDLSNYYIREIK